MQSSSLSPGQRRAIVLSGILWGACVLVGTAIMVGEEFTSVPPTTIVNAFPKGNLLTLAAGKPTLVLFLHPQCPCSRATVRELEKVVSCTQGKVAVEIAFTIPPGTPPGWEKGDLWNWAEAIPNAKVVRDEGGGAARRFGVVGSGHTLLFAPSGQLLFSGGITASRGEEGDNPGETAVIDLVLKGHAEITRTPVFGCSLL